MAIVYSFEATNTNIFGQRHIKNKSIQAIKTIFTNAVAENLKKNCLSQTPQQQLNKVKVSNVYIDYHSILVDKLNLTIILSNISFFLLSGIGHSLHEN